jgi:hypothetical protein
VATNVERKYNYVHTLEDKISAELEDDELYHREGREYESEYPLFSWWAWRFYAVVLPLIAVIVTVVLIYQEWARPRIRSSGLDSCYPSPVSASRRGAAYWSSPSSYSRAACSGRP